MVVAKKGLDLKNKRSAQRLLFEGGHLSKY